MKLIIRLLITAAVAYGLTHILSGVRIDSFGTSIIFAIVLGILNAILKPLLKFFGFPITILTLGLFLLVINALVILSADYFVDGVEVDGFWNAMIFGVTLSVITSLLNGIFIDSED